MPHASFVHLRVRSSYSLLEGAVRYDELAKACRVQGMPAVAVTDNGNLFGVMEFCAAAKKAGVQPIVGALLALTPDERVRRQPGRQLEPEQVVLLVKDAAGYASLLKMLSSAYIDGDMAGPVQVPVELLERFAAGSDPADRRCCRAGGCRPAAWRQGRRRRAAAAAAGGLWRPPLCRAAAAWAGGRAGDGARPGRAGLQARPAAGRHQRRAFPRGAQLRRARRADLHRPGRPGGAAGPAATARSTTASRPRPR